MTELQGNWNYPTQIRFGVGRISELAEACLTVGTKRPLVVTDSGLASLPIVNDAVAICNGANVKAALFYDIKPNPTGENIASGVRAYESGGHDGVVALGGGSSLDAGKAIALMVGQSQSLWDYEDVGDNWKRVNAQDMAPVIAVPTTAGTGSEVGRASVIVDTALMQKKIIFHPKMLPELVIADPALTVGLGPEITAATGMDALAHNLEAFCAPGYHPFADGIALEGLRLVKEWLPVAVAEGANLTARSHMLAASAMGATAFQKGLGGIHALAHPLGALYDVHHGWLNAVLTPYVVHYNRAAIANPMAHLARVLGLAANTVDGITEWLLTLRKEIGIPHTLQSLGIRDEDVPSIAQRAVEDPSSAGNPVRLGVRDYENILNDAIIGRF